MNFVHTFWRELLQIEGFFQTIQTPIIKAFKNNSKRGKISNPNTTKIFYKIDSKLSYLMKRDNE